MKMMENTYQITIGGNRTIAEVIAGSGYTNYDHSILTQCSLVHGPKRKATVELFSVKSFDHDLSVNTEIEAKYVRLGLKRPTVDHAIHFGNQIRDLPVEGYPIIFYLEVPVYALGERYVLCLWRSGVSRNLYLRWIGPSRTRSRYSRFAGVRE